MKEIFKRTPFLRVIGFFVILSLLVVSASNALLYRDRKTDNSSYQIINFYKEEKDSMDVVFIGSSCCFAYYSPLFAYHTYGIRTTNYSSSGMGMMAYKYAIKEARKLQNNAKIVLTITPLNEMNYTSLHYLADYMPMSENKLGLIKAFFSQDGESILNSIEYFFPLMRFHERWSQIGLDDLILDDGTKGATSHVYYLTYVNDISEGFYTTEERMEMPSNWSKTMSDLLDYCDEDKVEILFLIPPRTYKENEYEQLNSLVDYIENRGYEVLDLRENKDEIGLDLSQDYYDIRHTNIHGSIKYTDYVIRKVMEKYHLVSTNEKSEDFEKAFSKYCEKIKGNILDIELNGLTRDPLLKAPELVSITEENKNITLQWNQVEDADGYLIYRKYNNSWEKAADVKDLKYQETVKDSGEYLYTVVSYKNDGGIKYGNYDYRGLTIEVD